MVKEKIIAFLKNNGPSLPVEINKEIGYDTFLTQALLSELVNDGLVKQSKRAIGSSLIYYLPEQADKMRERIYNELNIPEKKTLQRIREVGRISAQDLTPHERAFIESLQDFIKLEKQPSGGYIVNYYSYNPYSKPIVQPVKETVTIQAPAIQQPAPAPLIKMSEPEAVKPPEITPITRELRLFENSPEAKNEAQKASDNFDRKARKYLDSISEVLNVNKIKANTEYEYIIKITKPFTQELLVKAKNKKSISETDLSLIYAQAIQTRKPAILLTNGKLTSKAKQWKDANAGELIKIIEL